MKRFAPFAAFVGISIATALVSVQAQTADPAKSTLTATFKQMGVPVSAPFKHFAATIDFDAAKPSAGHAVIDVDVKSLDLGDPEYNDEIVKPEWFDTAHFAHATFTSTAIAPGAAGQLNVTGTLALKGKTAGLTIPVAYKQDAGGTTFDGIVPVKRLQFDIGTGEWKDTKTLADEVQIKFHVVVPPKK